MLIRPAAAEDVSQVLSMVDKLAAVHQAWDDTRFAYKSDVGEMYHGWLTRMATKDDAVFLVAQADETLIGFLIATVDTNIPVFTPANYGWIHDLWVEENYRNEGVGRQLVMEAVERFGRIGVAQIRLETATLNDAARALFFRCGFRVSSIEMLRAF